MRVWTDVAVCFVLLALAIDLYGGVCILTCVWVDLSGGLPFGCAWKVAVLCCLRSTKPARSLRAPELPAPFGASTICVGDGELETSLPSQTCAPPLSLTFPAQAALPRVGAAQRHCPTMRRLALCLALLGAVSTGYGLQAAPAPSPPSSSGVAPEAGGDAEAVDGDGGECKAALREALSAAVGQPHGISQGELFDSIRLSSIAAARCRDSPLALGTALAKRAGSLFELGDAVQAVHNSWAALGATGALNFTHQTLASHMAATSDAVDAAGRLGRMQELSWMARELFNLGQQLTIIGQHDIGREALAASQDFSLQRWALQSDLHALRRAAKQPELDPAEAARRAVDPATRTARAQSNPVFMLHGEQASGPQSGHRTWQGEGRGTPVSRFAPPPRSLVRDVQAVAAAQGGDGVAWDADEGLVSVSAFSRVQWGQGYGRELDQLVLPPLSPDLTTSAAKAVTGQGPLPAAAAEVPAAWQWGATADSTSARYWEPEMFVAEFENVFVEGPSGVVYDNYRVYLNSHLEQVPLAKDFVGDAGTGAGTARPRELVRVATGVSLVQYKHNNYYHFVAEVLPRLFLALQHVTGGNTRSRHTPPSMLSRPKYIVPMGPPFIGGFIDLMGIGVEDMVVYHPDHTVVHADQLFVGDWRASVKRAPAAPLGVASSNHSHLPSIGASSVGANGEPSVVDAFPVELARRALDPSSIQHADPWLLGAGAERARQGDTSEYTHATMHHALARQAQQGRSEDDMRAVQDKRDITHLPPRTLLQQIRKHFAKVLLSPPPDKFAVDTASELAVLEASALDAAKSHGSSEKKVKRRKRKLKRKVKRKVRKAKNSKQPSASRSDKPGDAPHQTYAGFSSPFL